MKTEMKIKIDKRKILYFIDNQINASGNRSQGPFPIWLSNSAGRVLWGGHPTLPVELREYDLARTMQPL